MVILRRMGSGCVFGYGNGGVDVMQPKVEKTKDESEEEKLQDSVAEGGGRHLPQVDIERSTGEFEIDPFFPVPDPVDEEHTTQMKDIFSFIKMPDMCRPLIH